MNTKSKSLKENFGYLFEEAELGQRKRQVKRITLNLGKNNSEQIVAAITDKVDALTFLACIDFLTLKGNGFTEEQLGAESFIPFDETITNLMTKLSGKRGKLIEELAEFLSRENATMVYDAYLQSIKVLSEEGFTSITLSENIIKFKKTNYATFLKQAFNAFGGSNVEFKRLVQLANRHVNIFTSIDLKGGEKSTSNKQTSDGKESETSEDGLVPASTPRSAFEDITSRISRSFDSSKVTEDVDSGGLIYIGYKLDPPIEVTLNNIGSVKAKEIRFASESQLSRQMSRRYEFYYIGVYEDEQGNNKYFNKETTPGEIAKNIHPYQLKACIFPHVHCPITPYGFVYVTI